MGNDASRSASAAACASPFVVQVDAGRASGETMLLDVVIESRGGSTRCGFRGSDSHHASPILEASRPASHHPTRTSASPSRACPSLGPAAGEFGQPAHHRRHRLLEGRLGLQRQHLRAFLRRDLLTALAGRSGRCSPRSTRTDQPAVRPGNRRSNCRSRIDSTMGR